MVVLAEEWGLCEEQEWSAVTMQKDPVNCRLRVIFWNLQLGYR